MNDLDQSCDDAVGRLLMLTPEIGVGPAVTPDELPPPFHARLNRIFKWRGERRGGVAIVEEPGHVYDGRWIVFYTRWQQPYDFKTKLGPYMMDIGSEEPRENDEGWPGGPTFSFAECIYPIVEE